MTIEYNIKAASSLTLLGIAQNALPDSLISSAEGGDTCVAKLTSLVSARD